MSTTIEARVGEPYVLGTTETGLLRLSRIIGTREVFMIFGAADATAVADALIDAVENEQNLRR